MITGKAFGQLWSHGRAIGRALWSLITNRCIKRFMTDLASPRGRGYSTWGAVPVGRRYLLPGAGRGLGRIA